MRSEDATAFQSVIHDLCLAFNRPYSDELVNVFWEALKWAHILDIKRTAIKYRNTAKKFPTPHDLRPEKATAPAPQRDTGPAMSSWGIAANKILFACCFQSERGFKPVGPYNDKGECLDDSHQRKLLAVKRDYVRMAEEAQVKGETWDTVEFNRMCREGFQAIITEADTQSSFHQ